MSELQTPLADLLRSCVQCGLCLPHCATYLASGNEVQSPRGRLQLLGDLLERGEGSPPDSYLAAFDQCIGCQACETVCPSGVPFALLAHGQHLAADWSGGAQSGRPASAVPEPILRRMDAPGFLRLLGQVGGAARQVLKTVLGSTWRQKMAGGPAPVARLSRLLGSMPRSPAGDADLVRHLDSLIARSGRAAGAGSGAPAAVESVAGERDLMFFSGCANAGLLPASSRRLIDVLTSAGYAISHPTGQDCCGALAAHTGRPGRAALLQRRNETAFARPVGAGQGPIVVEAAGCGHELKTYGSEFASRVVDAVELLAASGLPARRSVPLRVAFHDPCHARHGQGITTAPRHLLASIPDLSWCEATEIEVCCGSGGAWGLRYPDMSADLARRKAADLAATGADLVVTTNPGCLGQIADGLALEAPDLPILPLTDLWWYATRPNTQ